MDSKIAGSHSHLLCSSLGVIRPEDGSGKKLGVGSPDGGESSSGESQDDKGPIIDPSTFPTLHHPHHHQVGHNPPTGLIFPHQM
ncbi:unnamed protein product, partial [Allacma fusca]